MGTKHGKTKRQPERTKNGENQNVNKNGPTMRKSQNDNKNGPNIGKNQKVNKHAAPRTFLRWDGHLEVSWKRCPHKMGKPTRPQERTKHGKTNTFMRFGNPTMGKTKTSIRTDQNSVGESQNGSRWSRKGLLALATGALEPAGKAT